jgi:hypothetical protein
MTYEFMVLFGGSLVFISLRRNNHSRHSRKRIPQSLKIIGFLVELAVVTVGVSTLMIGLIGFLR